MANLIQRRQAESPLQRLTKKTLVLNDTVVLHVSVKNGHSAQRHVDVGRMDRVVTADADVEATVSTLKPSRN